MRGILAVCRAGAALRSRRGGEATYASREKFTHTDFPSGAQNAPHGGRDTRPTRRDAALAGLSKRSLFPTMKRAAALLAASLAPVFPAVAGPFNHAIIGREELAAIPADDPRIQGWATGHVATQTSRGPIDITDPDGEPATFGTPLNIRGPADAPASGPPSASGTGVISLGDGGYITASFDAPIRNGPGPDFAVFENAFIDTFLELAFVEVSSNGSNFFRFPSVSLTPLTAQVDQGDPDHDEIDATNIDGLAGKYRAGLGTPFDLQRLAGVSMLLDVNDVRFVRIRDVIGKIDGSVAGGTATEDTAAAYHYFGLSFASNHLINDPWPTDFPSGGFDLDAIAVLNAVPEPNAALLFAGGVATGARRRRRKGG